MVIATLHLILDIVIGTLVDEPLLLYFNKKVEGRKNNFFCNNVCFSDGVNTEELVYCLKAFKNFVKLIVLTYVFYLDFFGHGKRSMFLPSNFMAMGVCNYFNFVI